jgi:CHAT domain-containing protein/Tfp pilus assembly protein PilF
MKRSVWLLLLLARAVTSQTLAPLHADELVASAKQAYTNDGPTAALPQFEKALAMYRSANDKRNEAIVLGYLANCQRRLGNLKQAADLAQNALSMKEALGDRDEIGKTHNQLGLIYWDLADYPTAIRHLQQAITIGKELDDAQLEGSANNNLGLVFDEQGDYTQSLEHYHRALDLDRSSHFERGESDALGNIGGVSLQLGRYREALEWYRQALAISERLGLKPSQAEDLEDIALCLEGIGEVDESIKAFDQALRISHEAGLVKEEADARRGKGTTLGGLGRYDAALEEYAKAQRSYEGAGLKRELVDLLIEMGQIYELLGDTGSADKHFHQASQTAEKIGNGTGVIAAAIALGELERRRKRYSEAEDYFSQALTSAKKTGDEGNTVSALIESARNDLDRRQLDTALRRSSEARDIAEKNGNRPAMASAAYMRGEVEKAQGQYQQALESYSSAERLQQELRDPELGWRILFGRGQALEGLGKDEEALESYKKSVELVEQTRAALGEERFRAGYIEERFQVYVALVELLLKLSRPGDAFFYSEKLRARAYFEQLGNRAPSEADSERLRRANELREQIGDLREKIAKEYSASLKDRHGQALEMFSRELEQAQVAYEAILDKPEATLLRTMNGPPSLGEIQRLLPSDTALVEYVVGRQFLSILTIKKTSVDGTTVAVTADSLETRTELFRDLILGRKRDWIEPGKGLHSLLIAPLEDRHLLAEVDRLIIVPDGVLNYVPFAALPSGPTRVLGDSFVVGYLPTAAALAAKDAPSAGTRTLLAMAPAESHLPNAAAEVHSIGRMFPSGSLVVAGTGATKTLFKEVAGQYEYVHLATHGSLNRNAPWLSTLQLQPDSQSDGRLELHEVFDLKLHARLVTLSACETALGSGYFSDTPAGDEFVGMTRAFLGAGSQSVLASLWAVNDESTRALMVKFYHYLGQFDAPEALSKAQREFRSDDSRYHDPYYWAAFVLVGSSRMAPEKIQ